MKDALPARPWLKRNRSNIVFFSSFCVALLSLSFLIAPFKTLSRQDPQPARLVDTEGSYPRCPIKIVSVETAKHKVVLGKPFFDDDDWMKGLTVRVSNSSDKALTHIGIKIIFDRPADQADKPPASWDLWYGADPFSFKPDEDIPEPLDPLIQPGTVQSITLTDSDYGFLRAFLWEVKFPSSIEKIHMTVYTIGFADGTAWGGQLYRRDRGSKRGWKPIGETKSSVRNHAVFAMPIARPTRRITSIQWKTNPTEPPDIDWRYRISAPDSGQCGSALIASHSSLPPLFD